jgi:hypothetical protein
MPSPFHHRGGIVIGGSNGLVVGGEDGGGVGGGDVVGGVVGAGVDVVDVVDDESDGFTVDGGTVRDVDVIGGIVVVVVVVTEVLSSGRGSTFKFLNWFDKLRTWFFKCARSLSA